MRKILVALATGGTVLAVLPLFAAFEAHVINVTAQIENGLSASTDHIDFGTVFPQEHLNMPLQIALSQSFLDEDRVDDIEYFIRQKPKCGVTTLDGQQLVDGSTQTGHIIIGDNDATDEVEEFYIDCGTAPIEFDEQTHMYGLLPSLCEYISKEPDGDPENDGTTPSFHQPWVINGDQIEWNDTLGRLAKSENDTVDNWTIDLAVPCFGNFCAQDWEDFVLGINPQANPDDFEQDIANEHKVFGCDLWVEVSGVSETPDDPDPETGTLTIEKQVTNDDGGTATEGSFTYFIDGEAVTEGVPVEVSVGDHTVSESGVAGYEASFSLSCDGGVASVGVDEDVVCTITNNDIPATINLIKEVVNDNQGVANPEDFTMRVNGTIVPHSGSIQVSANADHTIDEDDFAGYTFDSMTGDGCPGSLGGTVNLGLDETITCTIVNGDDGP